MKDLLTGLSIHEQAAIGGGGGQRQGSGEVYVMVGDISQGFSRSNGRCVEPGGAYPQVPGLAPGTEVYQWFDLTANGIGYGPGSALVLTPFFYG